MKLCGFEIGLDQPLFLIAGPSVLESAQMALDTAGQLKEIASELAIPFIYKASYDKANRPASNVFRGFGIDQGLRMLEEVRRQIGVPVLTDVHTENEVVQVASVVDVVQTPAFLAHQADFIRAVAQCGKPVNIKKGQFMAPGEMRQVISWAREAAREAGLPEDSFLACERGTSFGYHDLVADMRSLAVMRDTACPVVFDVSHAVQLPGALQHAANPRRFVPTLARAAVAAGISGLYLETHPDPDQALCDGPNALPLAQVKELLTTLKALDKLVKQNPWQEHSL
ncbi:3-deoxy-8-phosphooctulonate synthase [Chromobacterium sp. IIBBL 290-4]|uniref:3-deoxy-8-phosphooctulonate synthase n=1 Tax=Chromobacterium sp. IIBBL 290-4 TaxID=2953890 RepID=UPI0020B7189C|nr:3-deoxy-8-phosphooctulonate synthase [Chromobacterium sp. IIBBL 290-4]UTH72647.1 3-deoxy-8-phosphooctulonate synthase [Chromobacterium sp. IIBBL 290-4]